MGLISLSLHYIYYLLVNKKVGFIEYIWPQSGNFLYLFWQTV